MNCRHCGKPLVHTFLDLGFAPPSNAYLDKADLQKPEIYYPLVVKVCEQCWLVQTEDYARSDELFRDDYAYFSSTSASWVKHAKHYVDEIVATLQLNQNSQVIEIACNDGYLLQHVQHAGIPCLGIEPTGSTADAATQLGIPVISRFFGTALARELASSGKTADLVIGNNVYAHVPDINDFTQGLKVILKPTGTITLEFPHLLELIRNKQFDTVYHEHFSYLSLFTVRRIFASAGLDIFNVERLTTHGGSLRVYGCHAEDARPREPVIDALLQEEKDEGLRDLATYQSFQTQVDQIKDELLSFLIEQKRSGKSVAAYGAAAKGNTLLNYAGVKPDLLPFVCDAAPSKQGKYLPGSHIPILPPDALKKHQPEFLLILPWNIYNEIKAKIDDTNAWGCNLVTAIPSIRFH